MQQILTSLIQAAIASTSKASTVRVKILCDPQDGFTFHVETGTQKTFPANISMRHATALAELHGGTLILSPGLARFTLPARRIKRG